MQIVHQIRHRERQKERGGAGRERGNGAEPSLILPLQLPDEHPPDHHPWGATEQHKTAGSTTFITYRLFPSISNYKSFTDRQQHTVKLRCASQHAEYISEWQTWRKTENHLGGGGPVRLSEERLKVCRHLESVQVPSLAVTHVYI